MIEAFAVVILNRAIRQPQVVRADCAETELAVVIECAMPNNLVGADETRARPVHMLKATILDAVTAPFENDCTLLRGIRGITKMNSADANVVAFGFPKIRACRCFHFHVPGI